MKTNLGKVGVIGRFKPLHNGAFAMLKSLCEKADQVTIGIGSSNKYNSRNPFTAEETQEMLTNALSDSFNNFSFVHIPDFAHVPEHKDGQKWRSYVKEHFGKLDYFLTSNPGVENLLKEDYAILYPKDIIPKEKFVQLRASKVRYEIAISGDWKKLVPKRVANFLTSSGLIARFRKEFAEKTISEAKGSNYDRIENAHEEMTHAREE